MTIRVGVLLCLIWFMFSPYSLDEGKNDTVDKMDNQSSSNEGNTTNLLQQKEDTASKPPGPSLLPLDDFNVLQQSLVESQHQRQSFYVGVR